MDFIKITYQQLQENNYLSEYNDKYGLAAFVDDNIRKTFLNNPNNDDNSKTAILFLLIMVISLVVVSFMALL
jgi:hypothetical protein